MPSYRSVSQRNTYVRCAYKYKLSRLDKVWSRPASWLSQGLAVHAAMEAWELSDRKLSFDELLDVYRAEFTKSIEEQAIDTPNFEYWFGSGPYGPEQDIERRWDVGQQQLKALVGYSLAHPEVRVWTTPDGEKAVELEFFVEMGGVMVKGFIDQIVETPDGLIVRDIKTGAKPGDAFQLAVYSEAMRIKYGVEINRGDYFMGKTGKPTRHIPITAEDRADVHLAFAELEENLNAGKFPPNPGSICRMCDVATSCEFAER